MSIFIFVKDPSGLLFALSGFEFAGGVRSGLE